MEGAKGSKPVVGLPPPPEIRRLPLERGRAVLGAEALVFLLTYGRLLYRGAQVEIRTQVAEIRKELGGVRTGDAQVEMPAEVSGDTTESGGVRQYAAQAEMEGAGGSS